jgi:hypothetical protein
MWTFLSCIKDGGWMSQSSCFVFVKMQLHTSKLECDELVQCTMWFSEHLNPISLVVNEAKSQLNCWFHEEVAEMSTKCEFCIGIFYCMAFLKVNHNEIVKLLCERMWHYASLKESGCLWWYMYAAVVPHGGQTCEHQIHSLIQITMHSCIQII